MSAQFIWSIEKMECAPAIDNYTDVVKVVHWRCDCTIDGNTFSSRSACRLKDPINLFTPYVDLTEQQVFGWVWENYGSEYKNKIENAMIKKYNDEINSTVVTHPLPWVS